VPIDIRDVPAAVAAAECSRCRDARQTEFIDSVEVGGALLSQAFSPRAVGFISASGRRTVCFAVPP
jgi:hypothetical protein